MVPHLDIFYKVATLPPWPDPPSYSNVNGAEHLSVKLHDFMKSQRAKQTG